MYASNIKHRRTFKGIRLAIASFHEEKKKKKTINIAKYLFLEAC